MRQGELEYAYYDSSARPPFAVYRQLINGWVGLGGHPTRRLDFLVRGDNNAVAAYVEVTSINPTPEWVARSNREAQIYNAIGGVAAGR